MKKYVKLNLNRIACFGTIHIYIKKNIEMNPINQNHD